MLIQILSLNSNKILQKNTKKNGIKLFSFDLKLKFHKSISFHKIFFSKFLMQTKDIKNGIKLFSLIKNFIKENLFKEINSKKKNRAK